MIAARDNPDSGLTDADVAGNVLTMLLAGEDTTANTLAWMIYLLHGHPDPLRRAREEVLGKDLHHYESMTALPFIDACINETMRLKPVAPIIILQPTRDTVVAGIEVPKGTLLMCLMRAGCDRRAPLPRRARLRSRALAVRGVRRVAQARLHAVRRRARACARGAISRFSR